eukprot:3434582-Rhodomonas_salina.1
MAGPEDWDNFCQGPLECDEEHNSPGAAAKTTAARAPKMRCLQVIECIEDFVREHPGWTLDVQTQSQPPENVTATYWGNTPFVVGFRVQCGGSSGNDALFEHVNGWFTAKRKGVPIHVPFDRFGFSVQRHFEPIGLVPVHADGTRGNAFGYREPIVFRHCPDTMKKRRGRAVVKLGKQRAGNTQKKGV